MLLLLLAEVGAEGVGATAEPTDRTSLSRHHSILVRKARLLGHSCELAVQEGVAAGLVGRYAAYALACTVDESSRSGVLGRNTEVADVSERILAFS